jgi:hypothetical protein
LKAYLRNASVFLLVLGLLFAAVVCLGKVFSWLTPRKPVEAFEFKANVAAPIVPVPGSGRNKGHEPPLLQPLLEKGILPPTKFRVGDNPLVTEGTGVYGGTWFRASDSIDQALFDLSFRLAGATLVRWAADGKQVKAALAESWSHIVEVSPEGSAQSLRLWRRCNLPFSGIRGSGCRDAAQFADHRPPMLLSALLSQDTHLAASIIMLLTVLATLGTLVSDLLLVWLDPRIRLGGGS